MASITNEVLAEKIDNINRRLGGMEKIMSEMPSAFVSHEVLELKLVPLEARLADIETRNSLSSWVVPLATAVLSSTLTYLIIQQLQR